MVWEAWCRWKATKRPPSWALKADLKVCYGRDWRAVAGDLDNAVAEYGGWVDGKIHDRIEAYAEELHRSNRGIKDPDGWSKPDQEWMRYLIDEQIQYWVHGRVRQYYVGAMAGPSGGLSQGRAYYMEKLDPVTYDSTIDFDFTLKYEDRMVRVNIEDKQKTTP